MPTHFRKVVRIGPVRLHFTENGFRSWSVKAGRWSWNSRVRQHRVDLPGPWYWKSRKTVSRSSQSSSHRSSH